MKNREEIRSVLLDYIKMCQVWDDIVTRPTWYDALAFLSGYYGELNCPMVMVVRELQREGKIE